MLKIKQMKEVDIKFAKKMTDCERWGYLEDDFRRLIAYQPDGCFAAWVNQRRVGIITTTSYDDYAFMGSLIVKGLKRDAGIGTKLMNHAIEYLKGKGVRTIELDGVFPAVTLYRRLGFRDKYLSMRWVKGAEEGGEEKRIGETEKRGDGEKGKAGKRAGEAEKGEDGEKGEYNTMDIQAVIDFDRQKTGLDRERVIRRLVADFADRVYIIKKQSRLSAYAIVRPREGGYFLVGPMVAENYRVAEILLSNIVSKYSRSRLAIGVPEINRRAVQMVLCRGFTYNQPSLRMYWGERKDYEEHIYAILSPEKG